MALPFSSSVQRMPTRSELYATAAVVIAVVLLMVVLAFAYGLNGPGPSLVNVPDPAGNMPF